MRSGIELLLDLLHFDDLMADAHLVITGEGAADRQTLMGKAPTGIMRRAKAYGVPTALLAGRVNDRDALLQAGFSAAHCIHDVVDDTSEDPLSPSVTTRQLAATARALVECHRPNILPTTQY